MGIEPLLRANIDHLNQKMPTREGRKRFGKKYFPFYNHSSSRGKVKEKNPFYVDTISKIPLFNLTMKKSTAPAKRKQEKTFSILLLGKPLHFIAITFYWHRCFVLISDRKVATDAPFL